MKIISWNVNGLRAISRKGELAKLLKQEAPEIFLLQEIKADPSKLKNFPTDFPLYAQFYHSAQKPGYAGTSIWVKKNLESGNEITNLDLVTGLPKDTDPEGRVLRLDATWQKKSIAILSIYFPNGGKSPAAFKGKLDFYGQVLAYVNSLKKSKDLVIFAGDLNCAHQAIDLARPKENVNSIGFLKVERDWLTRYVQAGWVDVWRQRNPQKEGVYSWWHVITRARARNVGWRIDYFWLPAKNYNLIQNVCYLTQQMGSDHCPVLLEIG